MGALGEGRAPDCWDRTAATGIVPTNEVRKHHEFRASDSLGSARHAARETRAALWHDVEVRPEEIVGIELALYHTQSR